MTQNKQHSVPFDKIPSNRYEVFRIGTPLIDKKQAFSGLLILLVIEIYNSQR